jgi:hypothetical protein
MQIKKNKIDERQKVEKINFKNNKSKKVFYLKKEK